LPPQVLINFRTIQAWRNLGTHDKEDLRTIDQNSFIQIDMALNNVIHWFFNSILKIDEKLNHKEVENNEEINEIKSNNIKNDKKKNNKVNNNKKDIDSIKPKASVVNNKRDIEPIKPKANNKLSILEHIKGQSITFGNDDILFVDSISDELLKLANIIKCQNRKDWNSFQDAKAIQFYYNKPIEWTRMFFNHICIDKISTVVNKPENICPYKVMKELEFNANAYFLGSSLVSAIKFGGSEFYLNEKKQMLLAQNNFTQADKSNFQRIKEIIIGNESEFITGKLSSNGLLSGNKNAFWTNKKLGNFKATSFQFRYPETEWEVILPKGEEITMGMNLFLLNPSEIFINI
jgi:hypothetical protein